jgi:membrane-associated protein
MEALLQFITHFGPYAVAAVIFAETGLMVGFFLPGDSLLFTAGFLVQQQIFAINIHAFVALLFVASVVGNSTGYFFGHRVGRRLFHRKDSRFFRKEYLKKAEEFYERQGSKVIILAMFVPIVRTFTPIVAGISGMNYRKFLLFNVIGAAVWIGSFTYLGYFAGSYIKAAGINIEMAALIIITLSLLPGVIHVLKEPERRADIARKLRSAPDRLRRKK